ncbi:5-formyltetrahydrofolate cyclo-ligase [Cupriavidus numazuensis]|uniref:5-formyltetrahydrofolate cyclo-ligase n=1 Tax=Cupriavidus numazuensis TaxID=221992 RepID=A0ABM8TI70_9BURK|nr:5-formyltetrahydrofolate cyclo-ligase [Cupriavidus numazuensis]CAG2147981.1 5-formyltetrahydrofolate cyclo-ligase [Cupriavidus numazuensis]
MSAHHPPSPPPDSGPEDDRRAQRARLLALRAAVPDRGDAEARIAASLLPLLERLAIRCLGFYWPIQQEFDARAVVMQWLSEDTSRRAALPAVSRPGAPLDFHLWTPDTPMTKGHYGIPVPDGTDAAQPDALLIPCVGFSPDKFRLGYGGGFYDRTLAAMSASPVAIGIGFEACRIALQAQEHDLPMDWIVSEAGVF